MKDEMMNSPQVFCEVARLCLSVWNEMAQWAIIDRYGCLNVAARLFTHKDALKMAMIDATRRIFAAITSIQPPLTFTILQASLVI